MIGLTATPPDIRGKPTADVERYQQFFGPVDYEVPVPAVVKDGFLAPYQDLVQFVRPTPEELAYVANADQQLIELVDELCQPLPQPEENVYEAESTQDSEESPPLKRESLPEWLLRVLSELRHAVGVAEDWADFEKRDAALAWQARSFCSGAGSPCLRVCRNERDLSLTANSPAIRGTFGCRNASHDWVGSRVGSIRTPPFAPFTLTGRP